MDDLPTMDELMQAAGKMKTGRTGGISGITPEIIKVRCSDGEILDLLLDFIHTAMKEKRVSRNWVDAMLIPIPKKGILTICDDW